MLLISRPAGVLSSSVIRQLSISSYRLHPQRELIVRKKRGRVPWSSATIYSVVMAGKLGVHCKSCGKEIEIDDDYVRGIRGYRWQQICTCTCLQKRRLLLLELDRGERP